ncbi:hypothetical protein BB560_005595, partial [Smittium megazygosporum]
MSHNKVSNQSNESNKNKISDPNQLTPISLHSQYYFQGNTSNHSGDTRVQADGQIPSLRIFDNSESSIGSSKDKNSVNLGRQDYPTQINNAALISSLEVREFPYDNRYELNPPYQHQNRSNVYGYYDCFQGQGSQLYPNINNFNYSSKNNNRNLPKTTYDEYRFICELNVPTCPCLIADYYYTTFLNKDQDYYLSIADTLSALPRQNITIILTFHDTNYQEKSEDYWVHWLVQQKDKENARALSLIEDKSIGIIKNSLVPSPIDRLTFDIDLSQEVNLCLRFGSLSTDFSSAKGIKGVELGVIVKLRPTEQSDIDYPNPKYYYAKVKVFRNKGAERKFKDTRNQINNCLKKLQSMDDRGLQEKYLSQFRDQTISTIFLPYVQDKSVLASIENMKVSLDKANNPDWISKNIYDIRYSHRSISATNSPESFVSNSNSSNLMLGKDMDSSSNSYGIVRSKLFDQDTDQSFKTKCISMHSGIAVEGVDPSFVPEQKKEKAVLCLFLKFPTKPDVYQAIYLNELTIKDLFDKIYNYLPITLNKPKLSYQYCNVSVKCFYNAINRIAERGIKVVMDDESVENLRNEQAMTVE